MKKTIILAALVAITAASCQKQQTQPYTGKVQPSNGVTTEQANEQFVINYARVTFYTKQPVLLLKVAVNGNTCIGAQLKQAPECNADLHWANLPAGTYNYTAVDYHGQSFVGAFSVAEGECLSVELK